MGRELEVIKAVPGTFIERKCGKELSAIQEIANRVLLRMGVLDVEGMEGTDLFYYVKTLSETGKVAKLLVDIERGSPEKVEDELEAIYNKIMDGNAR